MHSKKITGGDCPQLYTTRTEMPSSSAHRAPRHMRTSAREPVRPAKWRQNIERDPISMKKQQPPTVATAVLSRSAWVVEQRVSRLRTNHFCLPLNSFNYIKSKKLPPPQRSPTFSIGCRLLRPKMLEMSRNFKNPLKLPSPPPHKGSSWPASPLSLVYYA